MVAKIRQTVFCFLGVAAIVGISIALTLYQTSKLLFRIFEGGPPLKAPRGGTVVSHQALRRAVKTDDGNRRRKALKSGIAREHASPALTRNIIGSPVLRNEKGRWHKDLYSSTILEEDDDSEFNSAS